MKKTFLAIILFSAYFCDAQNYQCLQSGVKHYFINANGYLRGIRIDSVKTMGDTICYYPFHTPRGAYDVSDTAARPVLDFNGGSWLGKKVLQKSDGTFIFDSYWNDSVIIKTQANIGDNWVFYKDTSSLYYTATVIAKDTMTILSSIDSVKAIMINAYDTTGIVTADPLNGFTIILSKNNGFIQVFDLYTFPYHKPDSVYMLGLDFFLDRSTCGTNNINNNSGLPVAPNPNITVFKLVDFINPNQQQLSNWDVGDIIESGSLFGYYSGTYFHIADTVTDRVISGHFANYTISGSTFTCPPYSPCSPICRPGVYSFSDLVYPLLDTAQMPEDDFYSDRNYLFYYPNDSSYCSLSPAYTAVLPHYSPGLGEVLEQTKYKLGIGKTSYNYVDGEPTYENDVLEYCNFNGISCGTPLSINNVPLSKSILLYPNPATTQVIITAPDKITNVSIINLLGQTVYRQSFNKEQVQADISDLPSGLYFVKVNDADVKKFAKE